MCGCSWNAWFKDRQTTMSAASKRLFELSNACTSSCCLSYESALHSALHGGTALLGGVWPPWDRLERMHRPTIRKEAGGIVERAAAAEHGTIADARAAILKATVVVLGGIKNLPLCSVSEGSAVRCGEVGPNGRKTLGMLAASPTGFQRIHSLSRSHQRSD